MRLRACWVDSVNVRRLVEITLDTPSGLRSRRSRPPATPNPKESCGRHRHRGADQGERARRLDELDRRAVDTIRVLAADAVQKVGNGHPGTAMSLAPLAYALFQRVMRHDPTRRRLDRPRPLRALRRALQPSRSTSSCSSPATAWSSSDLEALRTWGSKTPGHPEHGHTRGVEITTGPLGQGLASAVGMAMAARRERGLFDPDAALGETPLRPLHLRDRLATATSRRASPRRRRRSRAPRSWAT